MVDLLLSHSTLHSFMISPDRDFRSLPCSAILFDCGKLRDLQESHGSATSEISSILCGLIGWEQPCSLLYQRRCFRSLPSVACLKRFVRYESLLTELGFLRFARRCEMERRMYDEWLCVLCFLKLIIWQHSPWLKHRQKSVCQVISMVHRAIKSSFFFRKRELWI
jgi:hypothetical protein